MIDDVTYVVWTDGHSVMQRRLVASVAQWVRSGEADQDNANALSHGMTYTRMVGEAEVRLSTSDLAQYVMAARQRTGR